MYYCYILLLCNNDLYKGSTADLNRRLREHHASKVSSTKNFLPAKLIHYEVYKEKSDAQRRERYLKTTEGKRFLRQQLRDLFTQLNK